MRAGALGVTALLAAMFGGCGSRCHDICNSCSQPAGRTQPGSCPDACDELDDLSSAADCDDAWNAYLDCMSDRCDAAACGAERGSYETCIKAYCGAHPEDDRCDVVF